MRSIKRKMLAYFIPSTFILFTAALGFLGYRIIDVVNRYAYESASQYAREGAFATEDGFRDAITAVRSVAGMVEVLKAEGRTDRDILPPLLLDALGRYPSAVALWAFFAPDGWDGRDLSFASTGGYDETGNYAVWAHHLASGGMEVSTDAWGAESYEEDYYARPMETDGLWFSKPYEEEIEAGAPMVAMITVATRVRGSDGEPIGVVGLDMPIGFVKGILESIDERSGGKSSLTDNEGFIIADTLTGAAGTYLSDAQSADTISAASEAAQGTESAPETAAEPGAGAAAGAEAAPGSPGVVITEADIQGEPTLQLITSVSLDAGQRPWVFIVSIPKARTLAVPRQIYLGLLVAELFVLVVLVALIVFMAGKLSRPLVELKETFSVIAAGDMRPEVHIRGKDETGSLAEGFNRLTETLSLRLGELKAATEKLEDNAARLSDEMQNTGSAFLNTERSVHNVMSRGTEIVQGLEGTNDSVALIEKSIRSLGKSSRGETDLILHAVAAIEETLANIESVTKGIVKASEYYNSLNDSSALGAELLFDVIGKIKDVHSQSESLLETNTVIANIAAQTNLLAMNAAIEAAHAGEAGRGFAVVADEIRKLSSGASEQSKSVRRIVDGITDTIGTIAESSKKAGDNFGEIQTLIKTITRVEEEVKAAMEEQNSGSNDILASLDAMKAASAEMDAEAAAVSELVGRITGDVDTLNKYSDDIQDSIEDVQTNSQAIRSAVDQAKAMTESNRASIERMRDSLKLFKLKGEAD